MSYVSVVSVTAGLTLITCMSLCSCAAHACECSEESGKDCAGRCHAVPCLSLHELCCMQASAAPCQSRWGSAVAWDGSISPPWCSLSLHPLPILLDFHPVCFPERGHAPTCLLNLGFSQDNAVISGQ